MNRVGARQSGFTIVESMIFLAVSGVMFLSAMLFLSGQQSKTQFTTGVRDIQTKLTDIMNDISAGYYVSSGGCSVNGGGVVVPDSTPPAQIGVNNSCIFVGRVIQFGPHGAEYGNETAEIKTLVGKRLENNKNVTSLIEASPVVLTASDEKWVFPYGISIHSVTNLSNNTQYGSIGFTSKFSDAGGGGITGSQDIDLFTFIGSTLSQNRTAMNNLIKTYNNDWDDVANKNPDEGVALCFNSGGTNQSAKITIGGPGRQKSIYTEIYSSQDCT